MNAYNDKGEKHGPWEEYHSNGNLMYKENYVNGKKHGPWEDYYFYGNLNDKGNYVNGKMNGLWEGYHPNGNLKYKVNLLNNKKHGLCEQYNFNGNLWYKENYINGNKHGLSEKYNEDDKLYLKTILSMNKYNENGFREGFWEEYDYSINLMCKENYVNGKLSGIKEWYYIGPNNFYKDELKLKEYYL